MSETHVIVGGGLSAVRAAEALREHGFDGPVQLISVEEELPYERPVLSKGYLLESESRDSAFIHDRDWYEQNNIELRLGTRATGLDPAGQRVLLSDDGSVGYDKLLLATGSRPRRIDVPGADLTGVTYLRYLPDADRILAALKSSEPLVVVGAGWIGLEVASAARAHDVEVTVLEVADLPLQRVLGDEIAQMFADLHREHGVDLRLGVGISSIEGEDGRVTGVRTTQGDRVDAASVVVGIGATPQSDWAHAAGLAGTEGLDVDGSLRTSAENVFAVGDLAAVDHPVLGRRVRVEHWAWANDTGPVAGAVMAGKDERFEALPFFFSDQYDLGMEYIGHAPPGEVDAVVVRGDLASRAFQAFWLKENVVLAGMHANMWDDGVDPIKDLVGSTRRVDPNKLADSTVALPDA